MAPSLLTPGDPAPLFRARTSNNPTFEFHTVAGRTTVLCFFGSAGHAAPRAMLDAVLGFRDRFDDDHACCFGVSVDADDERTGRVVDSLPGVRYFWDFDRRVSALFGACDGSDDSMRVTYRPMTMVLDARLRVLAVLPMDAPERFRDRFAAALDAAPTMAAPAAANEQAPVVAVPRVFEPEVCRRLIAYYEAAGGEDSGFMRDIDGRTTSVLDHAFKRRRDCRIADEGLRRELMVRIHRRLVPELQRVTQFKATRMERYIVCCYTATEGGFFRPHRDNTTAGTAHRRFAVTINLNAEAYSGGDLCFPEYGRATFRAPTGGAVAFSCSLLHEALPVTAGRRFAFLPFLYDEEAARERERNNPFLAPEIGEYVAEPG